MKKIFITILALFGVVASAATIYSIDVHEIKNQFTADANIRMFKFVDGNNTCYGAVGTKTSGTSANSPAISCVVGK